MFKYRRKQQPTLTIDFFFLKSLVTLRVIQFSITVVNTKFYSSELCNARTKTRARKKAKKKEKLFIMELDLRRRRREVDKY